jgi:glycerol-3-phosphate dehydrogenase
MSETTLRKACVLGGGSFGTALALVLGSKGYDVKVWVRSTEQANLVNSSRENSKYLPGIKIPINVEWTSSVEKSVDGVELVLFAIPTQFLRAFAESNRSSMPVGVPLVL